MSFPTSRSLIGLFFAFAVWLVVAAGSHRGFDFTDEGAYYLTALHPNEILDRQTVYFYFGRVLFAVAGHNLVLTRCLLAAFFLAATGVFIRGIFAFTEEFAGGLRLGVWLPIAAITGSALAFSVASVAPSYNLFNALALLLATGFTLQAAAGPANSNWGAWRGSTISLILAAVALTADFFIKFSTCAILAAALIALFLLTSSETFRRKGRLILGCGALALGGATGYFLLVQSYSDWLRGVNGTWQALIGGAYLGSELRRYADEFWIQSLETLWLFEDVYTAVLGAAGSLLLFRRWPVLQRVLAGFGLATAIYMVARIGLQSEVLRQPIMIGQRFHLGVITVLSLAVVSSWLVRAGGGRASLGNGAWRVAPLLLLLAILPLAGSFGTTNNINSNIPYQFAPWMGVIVLLLSLLSWIWNVRWLTACGTLAMAAVTLAQFFHDYWQTPYRVPHGRSAQTESTRIGASGSTLSLDPASHEWVEKTRAQLTAAGFNPGDDIFAFFNLPGLVFALGGVSPGHPWYFSGDQKSLELDAMRVASVEPARRSKAFVITNGDVTEFIPYLKSNGLDFPDNYARCGEQLKNPLTGEVMEIWRPKFRAP